MAAPICTTGGTSGRRQEQPRATRSGAVPGPARRSSLPPTARASPSQASAARPLIGKRGPPAQLGPRLISSSCSDSSRFSGSGASSKSVAASSADVVADVVERRRRTPAENSATTRQGSKTAARGPRSATPASGPGHLTIMVRACHAGAPAEGAGSPCAARPQARRTRDSSGRPAPGARRCRESGVSRSAPRRRSGRGWAR